ncbi:phospholipase A1-Igamma2, chloroplastic-like [Arachis stenosperma]|uniref:phospholipase A1-Igamma2, chloroplastic-like n=1 Tax=Arachis stenosperma TaxID=217475 RepID=UPI0025AD4F3C|nr:phospholipase A1-Igamma2, chloroplastic-like [Arachis stenosperma]
MAVMASTANMLIAFQPNNNANLRKLQPPPSISSSLTTPRKSINSTTLCKATTSTISTNDSSLSSTITELQETPSPPKQPQPDISSVWRKLHGEDNWVGLLDPMDPRLRTELIRYGEMAQACYDSFDYDPYSKYCGSCRYPREEFFELLDMRHLGYSVSRYIYATANINLPKFFRRSRWPHKLWSQHANWAGYVAVSDDETTKKLGRRDITIAWRGTVTHVEWVADLMNYLRPISPEVACDDPEVKVEAGFLDLYTDREPSCGYCKYSARQQVLAEVKRLIEKYEDEEVSVTITGHSLGSAMAILSAFDIAETGLNVKKENKSVHVSVITFSGPRVGNLRFKERLESKHGIKVLRVHNTHDMVPKSPGFLINETSPEWLFKLAQGLPWSYTHVGVDLELDHKNSPYLNPNGDSACAHNLEAHLHLLDGYHGRKREFESSSGRDVALVNKDCDFLRDEESVPPAWRQDLNRGLVRGPHGRWMQPDRPTLVHDHPQDTDLHLNQLGLL